MPFTDIFGGTTIYSSFQSYISLAMTGNVDLAWPIEQQIGGDIVADIIEIASVTGPGLVINIPDARQVSTGYTALFNNVSAQTVEVRDAAGGLIASIPSGTAWQVYLRDNTTLAGLWRTFQYGASVSAVDQATLSAIAFTWTAAHTFTKAGPFVGPPITLASVAPILMFQETDASPDEQKWGVGATAENFQIIAYTDAGVATIPFEIARTLGVMDSISLQATDILLTGNIIQSIVKVGGGSAAAPTHSFSGDDNTGMYLLGSNQLGLSTNGLVRVSIATALAILDDQPAPTARPGWGQFYIDSADGDLKFIFGDGTVKTIVTDT